MTLDELVHANYHKLNAGDLEIWQYIYNHKKECAHMTIEECASQCNVSRTTILRFAKKLDLSGYTEFKYLLRSEVQVESNQSAEDGIDMRRLTENYTGLLQDLQERDYGKFAQMLDDADRVILIPSGHTQEVAVQEFQDILTVYTGKTVLVLDSRSRRESMLTMLQPEDVVVFISQSGENETLLEFARELKWRKIPIISFTQVQSNPIADMADLPIHYPLRTFEGVGEHGYTSMGPLYVVIEFYLAHYINHITAEQ